MNATKMRILRFAFACALVAGCFGLAACANNASSGGSSASGDSAASSAAASVDSSAAASSAAAEAASSAADEAASSAAEAASGTGYVPSGEEALGTAPEVDRESNPDAVAGTETTPALMPSNHASYLTQAELPCQTCHGTDDKGEPINAAAATVPKGHYVDEDPSKGQIDPVRAQCTSCHVVDPAK